MSTRRCHGACVTTMVCFKMAQRAGQPARILAAGNSAPGVKKLQRLAMNGKVVGRKYSVVFFADKTHDAAKLRNTIQQTMGQIDCEFSDQISTSALSQFNRAPCESWTDISSDLAFVVDEALEINRRSGGMFRLGASGAGCLKLDRTHKRLRKTAPMELNLAGILNGFAIDKLAQALEVFGIANYRVSLAGQIRASGCKTGGKNWETELLLPHGSTSVDALRPPVVLNNCAIATATDGQNSATYRLAQVTTIAPECLQADGWAHALLGMGIVDGPAFAKLHKMNVLFILQKERALVELGVGSFALQARG